MPNIVDRHRGGVVHEALTVDRLFISDTANVVAAPLSINSGAGALSGTTDLYNAPGDLRPTSNDTLNMSVRGMAYWWLEDTAGALLDATAGGVSITGSSAISANTLVLHNSTVGPHVSGVVISNSTGDVGIVFTSTGTSTARLFYALPTGLLIAGSTLIFT